MELAKKYVRCGLFQEARKLIEKEINMNDSSELPLLVMLSLIRDESEAINLSRLLLEKGYCLNTRDSNGLCALNYAIALKKLQLVQLYLTSFNFDLDSHQDRYKANGNPN